MKFSKWHKNKHSEGLKAGNIHCGVRKGGGIWEQLRKTLHQSGSSQENRSHDWCLRQRGLDPGHWLLWCWELQKTRRSSTPCWYDAEVKSFKKQLPSPGLTEEMVVGCLTEGAKALQVLDHRKAWPFSQATQRGTAGCWKDWVVAVWDSSHLRGSKAGSESVHRS